MPVVWQFTITALSETDKPLQGVIEQARIKSEGRSFLNSSY